MLRQQTRKKTIPEEIVMCSMFGEWYINLTEIGYVFSLFGQWQKGADGTGTGARALRTHTPVPVPTLVVRGRGKALLSCS